MKFFFKILTIFSLSILAYTPIQAQNKIVEDILLPDSLFFCRPQNVAVRVAIRGNVFDTFRVAYKLGNQPRVVELAPKRMNSTVDSIQYTFCIFQ